MKDDDPGFARFELLLPDNLSLCCFVFEFRPQGIRGVFVNCGGKENKVELWMNV